MDENEISTLKEIIIDIIKFETIKSIKKTKTTDEMKSIFIGIYKFIKNFEDDYFKRRNRWREEEQQ